MKFEHSNTFKNVKTQSNVNTSVKYGAEANEIYAHCRKSKIGLQKLFQLPHSRCAKDIVLSFITCDLNDVLIATELPY